MINSKNLYICFLVSLIMSIGSFFLGYGHSAGELAILKKELSEERVKFADVSGKLNKLNHELERFRTPEAQNKVLGQFVLNLMNQTEVKMSPARRQIIARTVVRVANDVFDHPEHKRWFATVLAIESRFDSKARSKAGAMGIGQLMPQYARGFAKMCGIDDYHPADLKDVELNMTFGACLFRALLESDRIKGNVNAALVGYNAGTKSKSLQQLNRMMNITNKETVNYIARWNFVSESAKNILNKELQSQEATEKKDKKVVKRYRKRK